MHWLIVMILVFTNKSDCNLNYGSEQHHFMGVNSAITEVVTTLQSDIVW